MKHEPPGSPLPIDEIVRGYVDAALAAVPGRGSDSTVMDADLDRLERRIGLRFPPSYRAFLKYKHFHELTETGVRFVPHEAGAWEARLLALYEDSWEPERSIGIGLIPFGAETLMDAGPVCFDTRARLPDGECPVVFWDHDRVGTEKEIQPMFSSSRRMFQALRFAARVRGFLYHDEQDPVEVREEQIRLLRQFLDIDPEGAAGPAKPYWTSMALGAEI